jgi:hypothetical protein
MRQMERDAGDRGHKRPVVPADETREADTIPTAPHPLPMGEGTGVG